MSASNMKSRKATARQQEIQLKATLKQLQEARTLNDQLMRERDDSEDELKKLMDKNTVLRSDLVEYDYKLSDAQDNLVQLQSVIDTFNQCASTHEVALRRITNLEEELGAANEELNYLRKERQCYDSLTTQNLYQELVGNNDKDSKNVDLGRPGGHFADTGPPSPGDLAVFLPWACDRLIDDLDLVVTKKIVEDLSEKPKAIKLKGNIDPGIKAEPSQDVVSSSKDFTLNQTYHPVKRLLLEITFDQYERVTGLQFQNKIPRQLMQIIGLIAKFHEYLTSMVIKQGLDAEVLYELKKVLLLSKITMVHIDNCFVAQGNYYILLDVSCLKNLSLTSCKITDEVVGMIAERLKFLMPRSSDLVALSLSNNIIGDVGAKSISDALRANVKLAYLNLAGNRISDTGAQDILNCLKEFALTRDEVVAARRRNAEYITRRRALVMEILKENRAKDLERRSGTKKNMKMNPGPPASSRKEKKGLAKDAPIAENADPVCGPDIYDKATATATKMLGPFNDPQNMSNTVLKEGEFFLPGNNTLCYLNLAYNNLTYFSVKTLVEVLRYQRVINKDPANGGLINVWLEGNPMPLLCKELVEIESILDKGLAFTATKRQDKRSARKSRTADLEKL